MGVIVRFYHPVRRGGRRHDTALDIGIGRTGLDPLNVPGASVLGKREAVASRRETLAGGDQFLRKD